MENGGGKLMSKREKEIIEITDLKDMLSKTKQRYGNKIAYQIKIEPGNYLELTHAEVRNQIDSLRNSTH